MRWRGLAFILMVLGSAEARAQVVALGASETKGYDVAESETWPAKLETLLRRRGVDVTVANEGINGDTSDGMSSRLDSAVPGGTRVVVFSCCGNDNKDQNHVVADHNGNIKSIIARLRARGIAVVYNGEKLHGEGEHDDEGAAIARSAGPHGAAGFIKVSRHRT
jgi:acyl-CoA thioesterase I